MHLSRQDILFLQNRIAYLRDEESYKKIFFHFHIPLYRFTFKIIQNTETADEIVSDSLMKIWSMGNKLAQVDRLNQYLFTSVKNASLTYLLKNRVDKIPWEDVPESELADKADTPENQMVTSEIDRRIEQAVSGLPTQCQLVYRLIKEEGFSYKEVCAILEVSQNTIETHMRIALKRIRLALEGYLRMKK